VSRAPKRGACIDPHGYDAGKKIKGKKRHILVDTLGLLLHAMVHSAGTQDRDGGCFHSRRSYSPTVAYQGPLFATALAKILPRLETEILKR
jgi:hypothetical protein